MMPAPLVRKSLQEDLAFVERQLAHFKDAPFDTARLMWEQRRQAILEELLEIEKAPPERLARVALIFQGAPVRGHEEIRLDFATKALDSYQSVVASLVAERAGVEVGTRGKLPAAFNSRLFIRDMVRGSVGFILEEAGAQYPLLETALHDAVQDATSILRDLASAEKSSFDDRMSQLKPRTVAAVKRLSKVLHDAGAETHIVGDGLELSLTLDGTASLYSRLSEVEVIERRETRHGMLLGLFPERQQYEFKPADGKPVFYGPVSESLDAKYLTDAAYARSIILKPAVASFLAISTIRGGILQQDEWVLEEIDILHSK